LSKEKDTTEFQSWVIWDWDGGRAALHSVGGINSNGQTLTAKHRADFLLQGVLFQSHLSSYQGTTVQISFGQPQTGLSHARGWSLNARNSMR